MSQMASSAYASASTTPPGPRSVPVSRTTSKKNHVVPFTRHTQGGLSWTGSEEPGSRVTLGKDSSLNSSLFKSKSCNVAQSLEGVSPRGAVTTLRRPNSIPSAPVVRQEGFATTSSSDSLTTFQRQPSLSSGPGLLSRQFSRDTLAEPHNRPFIGYDEEPAALKEKLQQCFERSPEFSQVTGDLQKIPVDLLSKLQEQYPIFKKSGVTRAFTVARCAHEGQYRRNGEPVFLHCVETAKTVAELGLDQDSVSAALLHDVLDDSMMTETHLRKVISADVVNMVKKVSQMSTVCQLHRDSLHHGETAIDLSTALSTMLFVMADERVVLIKLADRLHNMRTISALPQHKQVKIAEETLSVFAPIISHLGVWHMKAELEDLCFKVLHPREHAELEGKLRESQQRGALEQCLDVVKHSMEERGIAYEDLSGRPKNLYGVFKKMQQKGYTLDEIYDVRALRVIVKSKQDCYRVFSEVTKQWPMVEGRFKDYIRNQKPNGYQSLHVVVRGPDGIPIEVQIRTHKMHYIAEYGLAAHWRYKGTAELQDQVVQQKITWARFLISWQHEIDDKKCRPTGSPPRGTSLTQLCLFPQHSSDCKFAKWLRSMRIAPQPVTDEQENDSPVYFTLANHITGKGVDQLCIEQAQPRCTVGQLLESGALGSVSPYRVRVVVNHEEVHDSQLRLHHGDTVEMYEADDDLHYLDAPANIEAERQRLSRLYHKDSGDLNNLLVRQGQPIAT